MGSRDQTPIEIRLPFEIHVVDIYHLNILGFNFTTQYLSKQITRSHFENEFT